MSKVNESLKDFWSRCSMRLDRTIQSSFLKQVAMLVAVNAAVLLICFLIWGLSRGEWNLWMVYNNYIDTGNQAGAGNSERWIAVITSVFGSFLFGCLLISTLSNIIERRIDRYRSGLVRYRHSRHSVIIGADPMLDELVSQLLHTSSEQDIVILTTKDTDQVRRHLTAGLSPEDSRRIFICYGSRDSGKDLESIHISLADKVYILGESGEIDDIEYFHDSLNVDCLYKIGRICLDSGRTDKLKCWMSMEYRTTFNVFQFSDIPPGHKAIIDLHPFNFYEDWARKVLVLNRFGDKKYKPLDYNGIISYESDSYVHLVIIGMSKMGEAMAIEAAHIAHFPNFIRDRSKKTRITFIDREARACADEFMQTFPYLFDLSCSTFIDTEADTVHIRKPSGEFRHLGEDFLDIEWQFVQGRIESEPVRRLLVFRDDTFAVFRGISGNMLQGLVQTVDSPDSHAVRKEFGPETVFIRMEEQFCRIVPFQSGIGSLIGIYDDIMVFYSAAQPRKIEQPVFMGYQTVKRVAHTYASCFRVRHYGRSLVQISVPVEIRMADSGTCFYDRHSGILPNEIYQTFASTRNHQVHISGSFQEGGRGVMSGRHESHYVLIESAVPQN